MFQVTLAEYTVKVSERLPAFPEWDFARATLVDQIDMDRPDGATLYVEVRRGLGWPFLIVVQRYEPTSASGFHPGIFLVPESRTLFIGAGERVLCYALDGPVRLWEDQADTGFLAWQRHGNTILMSAELEAAAWDIYGKKLWSTFVEPPWEYHIEGELMFLNIMGSVTSFPLTTGPAQSERTPVDR